MAETFFPQPVDRTRLYILAGFGGLIAAAATSGIWGPLLFQQAATSTLNHMRPVNPNLLPPLLPFPLLQVHRQTLETFPLEDQARALMTTFPQRATEVTILQPGPNVTDARDGALRIFHPGPFLRNQNTIQSILTFAQIAAESSGIPQMERDITRSFEKALALLTETIGSKEQIKSSTGSATLELTDVNKVLAMIAQYKIAGTSNYNVPHEKPEGKWTTRRVTEADVRAYVAIANEIARKTAEQLIKQGVDLAGATIGAYGSSTIGRATYNQTDASASSDVDIRIGTKNPQRWIKLLQDIEKAVSDNPGAFKKIVEQAYKTYLKDRFAGVPNGNHLISFLENASGRIRDVYIEDLFNFFFLGQ